MKVWRALNKEGKHLLKALPRIAGQQASGSKCLGPLHLQSGFKPESTSRILRMARRISSLVDSCTLSNSTGLQRCPFSSFQCGITYSLMFNAYNATCQTKRPGSCHQIRSETPEVSPAQSSSRNCVRSIVNRFWFTFGGIWHSGGEF